MILVLRGADFSENNIGSVQIDRDIEQAVSEMMTHVTRFPSEKTNEYAQALNTLYINLVSEGLWSKLKLLSIPFYSSAILEAGYNLIANTAAYGSFANAYELNANNEAVVQHKQLLNSSAGGWSFAATPSNAVSFFGIMSSNGDTQGHFLIAGKDFYTITNQFIINRVQRETYFQVYENNDGVHPLGGSGAFGGNMTMPEGAFVASYDSGNFHYMDSRFDVPKEGEPITQTSQDISTLTPSIWTNFPITPNENLSYKLIGAASNLTSQETLKLFNILKTFNNNIS